MPRTTLYLAFYIAAQLAAVSLYWYRTVDTQAWVNVQQFIGHLGPGAFLVAMGAAAIFMRGRLESLIRIECWLAPVAGGVYVLGDTFLMHPPLGVFDGAGHAEQEHVAIMGLIFFLGVSGLVAMRRIAGTPPHSVYFVIGIAVVALVFLRHPQHTMAGTMGHQATILMLSLAGLFRILDKMVEYGVAMIVSGFVFFSAQMGLAMYVDMVGHSPNAWVALWIMLGFASATGFLLLAPSDSDQP